MLDTQVLHQYYTSQHRKVQLRNDTIVSLRMHTFCYAHMIKTHTICAHQNTSSTHGLFHMKRMHHSSVECETFESAIDLIYPAV